jgi:hypothetical protein
MLFLLAFIVMSIHKTKGNDLVMGRVSGLGVDTFHDRWDPHHWQAKSPPKKSLNILSFFILLVKRNKL